MTEPAETSAAAAEAPASPSSLTARSLLLGTLLVAIVNVGAPYAKYILHSSLLANDYLPFGVVFPFLVVVMVLNPLLKRLSAGWALRPGELGVVFAMALVGSTLPTFGVSGYLISTIAAPYYYATVENGWETAFHPHLPSWLVPSNEASAMDWFFEGMPQGAEIPWSTWVMPLFWWLSFVAALLTTCFCIVAILRKQWIERERIVFPLAEVPLDLIRNSDDRRFVPRFARSRLFWGGFAIPFVLVMWNVVGFFYPSFPSISFRSSLPIFGGALPLLLFFYFPLIGFAYLIRLDVSFSIWFFHLLAGAQVGIFHRFGYSIGAGDIYCSWSPPMAWQGFGALAALVVWGLWMAREHLGDVFRKALGKAPDVDDAGELLSYRAAVLGMVVGFLYMVLFLVASGMSIPVVVVFLIGVFVVYLGVTRIVIEGGLVFLRGPMIAQHLTVYSLGVTDMSARSLSALALSYGWFCDIKSFFMPAAAHAAKLSEVLHIKRRDLVAGVAVALVIGLAASMAYTLYMGYQVGAYNYGDWIFRRGAETPYDAMAAKMQNPFETDWERIGLLAIGAIAMTGMSLLKYRFSWWPLNPIGFPVAYTLPVRLSAFSIFLAWAAKSLILRFGGIGLYDQCRPFFMGLVVGFFWACGISFVVDMIWFPGEGHLVYGW